MAQNNLQTKKFHENVRKIVNIVIKLIINYKIPFVP